MSARLATMAPEPAETLRQPAAASGGRRLQRRCACGATTNAAQGECDDCKAAKIRGLQTRLAVGASDDAYEREADTVASRVMRMSDADVQRHSPVAVQRLGATDRDSGQDAPAVVDEVLRAPGQSLDGRARAFFEPRFGADFSRVRVHDDEAAARSARAVSAQAYTVGSHVVFGRGHYAPQTAAGRALLAHELTHVVQQRAVVQRHSISPDVQLTSGEEKDKEEEPAPVPPTEDEEATAGGGIALLGVRRLQRTPDDPLEGSGWPEKDEAACIRATPPDPAECDPARALTWADFAGTPGGGGFSASTFSGLRERSVNTAALTCSPAAATAGLPNRAVQAFMDPARSWVRPQFANAADPAQNGCAANITGCERGIAAGQVDFKLDTRPSRTCPASVTPAGTAANTVAECTTNLGADCNSRAVAESARLLRHEQGHFDLSCAMARKANAMLATARSFEALLAAAQATLSAAQARYDAQSRHGCNASQQASWETDIAAGLPTTTITIPPAGGRRRR